MAERRNGLTTMLSPLDLSHPCVVTQHLGIANLSSESQSQVA